MPKSTSAANEERAKLVTEEELHIEPVLPHANPRRRKLQRRVLLFLMAVAAMYYVRLLYTEAVHCGELAGGLCGSGSKVHILLLEADQVRPDAHEVGSTDARLTAVTPNLDGIARQGVRFSRAYSSTPICTPARLALLTGRSPARHGMRSYAPQVPTPSEARLELVSTMAAHGYYTSIVGKNHYGVADDGRFESHGYLESQLYEGLLMYDGWSPSFVRLDDYGSWFNHSCPGCDPLATTAGEASKGGSAAWRSIPGATIYNSIEPFVFPYAEELHPTRWTADAAIRAFERWLTQRRRAAEMRSLFLKVSFHRPHQPYDPPERVLRNLLDTSARIAIPALGNWDSQFAGGAECTAGQRRYCGGSCGYLSYCGRLEPAELLQTRAAYLASLSFVDEQAGRLLKRMQREPEWRDTFVMYLTQSLTLCAFSHPSVPSALKCTNCAASLRVCVCVCVCVCLLQVLERSR